MKALAVAVVAVFCLSCGGDDGGDESLTDMCVRRFEDLYEKHDLPYTRPESDRAGICDDFMADNDVTTKAQLEIAVRQADRELDELD